MRKNYRGTALLMGMMLVAIIMFVVVSVSRNTLHALLAGTNISDWEIAHQAAETAAENALLGLNLVGTSAISSPLDRSKCPPLSGDNPTQYFANCIPGGNNDKVLYPDSSSR